MRRGCSGVAIGCAGITAVIDDRGRSDLFGRKLEVTQRAVADNIASAAELVMGEADECIPAAIVRGLGMPVGDQTGIEAIDAEECLFMGVFRKNAGSLELKKVLDNNPEVILTAESSFNQFSVFVSFRSTPTLPFSTESTKPSCSR